MKKYTIGIDYGSLSGRILLADVENGEEVVCIESLYKHAVMDEVLPDGITRLAPETALQHPQDYLDVLMTIPDALRQAKITKEQVIGIGVDFTSCTVLPIDKDGTPLCFHKEYENRPHAYSKLWKHHAAQYEADRFNQVVKERQEEFIKRYGGKMSSEWVVPKAMQILHEDEELYHAMDRFIEGGDWIVLSLTGSERRSLCQAGYKAVWSKRNGYPSDEFFKALDPKLEHFVDDKLSREIYQTTDTAGYLTKEAAKLTGLMEGTAVAVANVDAHVALPAVKITEPGKMLMIMGTSTCHIMMGMEEKFIPGVGGVVEDGVVPGYFAYEAGQACVGDHFDWMVHNAVPTLYEQEANERKIGIHQLLTEKASRLKPGESGLLALDWWNGNRSILTDADLTGMLLGCTLLTKPEEIYRTLIEATAFGTRVIIEAFEESGVPIKELFAAGGIARKNEMLMQIYADITKREIRISSSAQAPALGAALFGAVAAGSRNGGYDTIEEASEKMSRLEDRMYSPIQENAVIYDELYKEYKMMHDYFGKENNIMKRLKKLRNQAKGSN
ncbi:ribulokinase [Lachnotalea glycerini]|uniref:Ribulokinase n=1 Tax=Lachnotalea glycerini TaxID=1763509 RepID=A0A371JHE3_9FIRM|nr:ribulokinase [Lachnotalea glycerini]RDY32107.1 ribulokinase [Lachnotalea glycerini]